MSRQYHEQIEVQCDDVLLGRLQMSAAMHAHHGTPVPTAFMWRGRVHVVRAVVAAWTQRVPWWRLAEVDTASSLRTGAAGMASRGNHRPPPHYWCLRPHP